MQAVATQPIAPVRHVPAQEKRGVVLTVVQEHPLVAVVQAVLVLGYLWWCYYAYFKHKRGKVHDAMGVLVASVGGKGTAIDRAFAVELRQALDRGWIGEAVARELRRRINEVCSKDLSLSLVFGGASKMLEQPVDFLKEEEEGFARALYQNEARMHLIVAVLTGYRIAQYDLGACAAELADTSNDDTMVAMSCVSSVVCGKANRQIVAAAARVLKASYVTISVRETKPVVYSRYSSEVRQTQKDMRQGGGVIIVESDDESNETV